LSSFGKSLGSADRKPAHDQGEKVPAEAPLLNSTHNAVLSHLEGIPLGVRARRPAETMR
jgi:hypothetical protein